DSEKATDDEGDGDEELGEYPIYEWTRIVITTHAAISRRGFSKFMRGIWSRLGPIKKEKQSRPAFAVIIDEAGELVEQCHQQIDLEYRFRTRREPDGNGGTLVPLHDCPRSSWSGNCGNCTLAGTGGELTFNGFGIRELGRPRPIQMDSSGNRLRKPRQ